MIKNYIKIAFKVLKRRKFFTFISLFAVSFTLVVLMVAAALLDHIFAPMKPQSNLGRMLGVYYMRMIGPQSRQDGNPGYGLLDTYARNLPGVETFSIFSEHRLATSYHNGIELKSYLKRTDAEYWRILDFDFLEGGPITRDDEKNANFVAVINEATKQRFFEGAPAVGNFIEVDRQRFRVVGVVENIPALRPVPFADIWVPNSTTPRKSDLTRLMGGYIGLFLAHDAADFTLIKQEFKARLAGVRMEDPKQYERMEGSPETFPESVSRDFLNDNATEGSSTKLAGVVLFLMFLFMLLPTINLININVSRIRERASEIGVRKSFGASSRTLVGQFIVENVFLTLVGGIIGFILSALILQIMNGADLIQYAHLQLNARIFLYGFIIILVFGMVSGVYPAWKMSRIHPVEALKGATR